MTNETYICKGSVRGECGHKHRTVEAAVACCARDQKAIRRAYPSTYPTNAYSDRSVFRSDGSDLEGQELVDYARAIQAEYEGA